MQLNPITATLTASFLIGAWCAAPAQSMSERQILIDFYQATNGENWYQNEGWLSEAHHCDWYGITCDGVMVTGIDLPRNNLSGPLGAKLFDLRQLSDLDLSDNFLSGNLPARVINDLPMFDATGDDSFVTLDLSHNNLGGNLPEFTRGQGPGDFNLLLDGNDLSGPIPPSWVDMQLSELSLRHNRLDQALIEAWKALPSAVSLDLSNAGLSGAFPESPARFVGDTALVDRLGTLDLSRNDLEGRLPSWLANLQLSALFLHHNDLTGPIDRAIAAVSSEIDVALDLADNKFSGPIPPGVTDLSIPPNSDSSPFSVPPRPGLNLCWNDLEMPDGGLLEFIDARHLGGSYANCQQPRQTIGPSLSGSRYDPARSGEGFVQHVLDNGNILLFWFTYPVPDRSTARQAWFLDVVSPEQRSLWIDRLLQPSGSFGEGSDGFAKPGFPMSIDPLEGDAQQVAYNRAYISGRSLGGIPIASRMSIRQQQTALTRLAGTSCDNQQPHQWISGAWYNPDTSGEGFMVEVNEDGRVVVYWFTFQPNRGQAWMIGSGEFSNGQVIIDDMIQPVGTRFGIAFDSTAIEHIDWGSLTLTFDDDTSGQAWFESNLPEYGSGSYPIERLARPALADCPQ